MSDGDGKSKLSNNDKTTIRAQSPSIGTSHGTNELPYPEDHTLHFQAAHTRLQILPGSVQTAGNLLTDNSIAILSYAVRLRDTDEQTDISLIHQSMVKAVGDYADSLKTAGKNHDVVMSARYLICTFVDEMILSSAWGLKEGWEKCSILSFFHKEQDGSTKFFSIIDKVLHKAHKYIELLELAYVCLAMGYIGKFRSAPNRNILIHDIKEQLFLRISQHRQQKRRALSSCDNVVSEKTITERELKRQTDAQPIKNEKIPLLSIILACIVLASAYFLMLTSLNSASSALEQSFSQVRSLPLYSQQAALTQSNQQRLSLPLSDKT